MILTKKALNNYLESMKVTISDELEKKLLDEYGQFAGDDALSK